MSYRIAGIDVHKRMLAVVVADVAVDGEYQFDRHLVGTSPGQLRALAGGDATRIGEGQAQQFSPDGRSVLSVVHGPPSELTVLPIGPGDARKIPTGSVTVTAARWLPDGRRLLIVGTEPGKRLRAYVTDVSGAAPRPVAPEGITFMPETLALSPDGSRVAFRSPDGQVMLYRLDGGEPNAVNGLKADEMPTAWTGDGRALVLLDGRPPRRILRLDPASGRRELLKEIRPSDSGLLGPTQIVRRPMADRTPQTTAAFRSRCFSRTD